MVTETRLQLVISTNPSARAEVFSSELAQLLVKTLVARVVGGKKDGSRSGLDLWIAFVGSSSAVIIARTIQDFVRTKRIKLTVTREDGSIFALDASGPNLDELSNLVGFLEGKHSKETLEIRRTDSLGGEDEDSDPRVSNSSGS